MNQNLTKLHRNTLHHKNLHQHPHSLWHNRTKQLGGTFTRDTHFNEHLCAFRVCLSRLYMASPQPKLLMIKKPAPALTRFLKIFTVLFTVVGVFAIIGGLAFPTWANLVILVSGAFLATIFIFISLTQIKL